MAEIDGSYTISYWSVIVPVFELFDVEEYCNLGILVRDHSKSLERAPFDRLRMSSCSSYFVTVTISCIVSEIK